MVAATAEGFNVPLVGLVALGQAESNWRRTAERYGLRTREAQAALEYGDLEAFEAIVLATLPDVSWGYGQITFALAGLYGLGDGKISSIYQIREALFDRERNFEISASHYAHSLRRAQDHFPGIEGDDWLLQGLIAYNAGSPQEPNNWYWSKYAGNIERYREALAWAHGVID